MAAPPARPHISTMRSSTLMSSWQSEWTADEDAWDSASDSESAGKPSPLAVFPRNGLASSSSLAAVERPLNPSDDAGGKISVRGSKTDTGSNSARPSPTPIPVRGGTRGRTTSRASTQSQDHSFSFTHVIAPSPSSYPPPSAVLPAPEGAPSTVEDDALINEREQAGWVRIRTIERIEGEDSPKSSPGADSVVGSPRDRKTDRDGDDVVADMVLGEMELEGVSARPLGLGRSRQSIKGKEAVRPDISERVRNPFSMLRSLPASASPATPSTPPAYGLGSGNNLNSGGKHTPVPSASPSGSFVITNGSSTSDTISASRHAKVLRCLSNEEIDFECLAKEAWKGIHPDIRPIVWQLLLSYLPLPASHRLTKLHSKRQEYHSFSKLTFSKPLEPAIWHQIEIDVPRTRPGVPLWSDQTTQRCLERILYIWAIKHPASGYVQGINDLVTPFFQVFLSFYVEGDPSTFSPSYLPPAAIEAIEADSFWCLTRLLDGIQDNYIFAQPGIVRSVRRMGDLVGRIDAPLAQHLQEQGVEYMQFAFRWMNCLLMREFTIENIIRMWDTYLSEGPDAFSTFHLYVCTAFLLRWSKPLQEMDFQGGIMFLQSLPTEDWNNDDIEQLMSEAWRLNQTYEHAWRHVGTPR